MTASSSDSIFANGGETGRLMADLDWASTPLGPVDTWPQSLRAAVRIALRSRYPMLLTWGPQYTQLYNDAYSQLIGDKHPQALGDDVRVTLAEGWDVLGPLVDQAMGGGDATWVPALQLLLERSGYREEAYFTVSHASAADDDGRPAGMVCVCSEVTDRVIGERWQRLLRELPAAAADARTVEECLQRVLAVLAEHPLDVPFAAAYVDDGGSLRRVGATVAGGLPEAATDVHDAWGLRRAAAGEPVELDGVASLLHHSGGPWGDAVERALSLPLAVTSEGTASAVLLAATNPNRALDDGLRAFFDLLAAQVSGLLRSAAAYEEERRRVEALAALDKAKTDFFAGISHEFRTPLTLLLGPLEDALADASQPLAAAQHERVELAARNARRMLKLVNALLDFSRLQGGAAPPQLRAVDLAQLTADLASVFRAAVERAGVRLTVDCPPLASPVAVDPDMWEQIVLNLLSNAFKHTFTGEIRVALREDGGNVVLEVADTGIGIAPEEQPRLFERFHRVADVQARTHEGTGIGLALVHDLAEVHGGAVAVTSAPGAGSTFTVTVPARRDTGADAGERASSQRAALSVEEALGWDAEAAAVPSGANAGGARVLVVDDNADMRGYVARLLQPSFEVLTAADGAAALELVVTEPVDLVLTDVMMPQLDGFGLLAALRGDARTAAIPVVVLTARSGPEAAVEGLERGADDYLAKPFTSDELLARVRANLARGVRRRDAADAAPRRRPAPRPQSPQSPPPAPVEPEVERTGDALSIRLPAVPRALRPLRQELRGYLADVGLTTDDAESLVLAACEAATNAIEHAQDVTDPTIAVAARLEHGRVVIDVRNFGRWRPRGAAMDRGRGSAVMEAFADVHIEPSAEGTLVTLTSKASIAA